MAFQPTKGRQKFVQPTGMPDLGGFRRAASVYDNLAKQAYSVGSDIRKSKLNDLILEAEASGMSAGATYDTDGNIVPLTNLDIGDHIESQVIGTGEKERLRQVYRDAAVKTYQVSISNAAEDRAKIALNTYPNQPEKVIGEMKGFVDGLGLSEEMQPYIMPSIVRKFTSATSSAKAQQVIDTKNNTIAQNTRNVTNVQTEIAQIMAKGAGESDEVNAGSQKMLKELNDELEGSYSALESVGYSEEQIGDLRRAGLQTQQVYMSTAHVERMFHLPVEQGGGYVNALKEISVLKDTFADAEAEGLDVELIETAMKSRLTDLKRIKDAKTTEEDRIKSSTFTSAALSLAIPGDSTMTVQSILAMPIDADQKTTLLSALSTKESGLATTAKGVTTKLQENTDETFERLMLAFDLGDASAIEKSSALINDMYFNTDREAHNRIKAKQYRTFLKAKKEYIKGQIAAKNDVAMALIEEGIRNNTLTVSDLNQMTPILKDKGYIGEGTPTSLEAWQKIITGHNNKDQTKRNANLKLVEDLDKARTNLLNGTATMADRKLVSKHSGFALASDAEGQNILHSDSNIREQNMDKIVKYTLAYEVLHPEVEGYLSNLTEGGEEALTQKIIIYDQLMRSLQQGSFGKGFTDSAMPQALAESILQKQGIDIVAYEQARFRGAKPYLEMKAITDSAAGRSRLNNIESKLGIESIEKAISDNFNSAVQPDGFTSHLLYSFGFGEYHEKRENMILADLTSAGSGDGSNQLFMSSSDFENQALSEEAFLKDPKFMTLMTDEVNKILATTELDFSNENIFKTVLRKAAINLESKIGLSTDSIGQRYWEVDPWYKKAAASIGDVPMGDRTVSQMVFGDVRRSVLGLDGMLDEKITGLLNDEDNPIKLVPERLLGEEQTYMVQVTDIDTGLAYNVKSGYSYDFNTSVDNPAYQAAIQRVKNSTVQKFLASMPFLKGQFVANQIENILADLDNDANWFSVTEPELFVGKREIFTKVLNNLASVINTLNPIQDSQIQIDPQFDSGDVKVLRDFISGKITSDKDYIKTLEEYYK